jgi:hypothetical protein
MELPTPRGAARKGSPPRRLSPALVPLALAALLLAGGGGWLAFTDGGRGVLRAVLPRLAAYWSGRDGAERIEVGLRNLSMTTLAGGAAGELYVIRGEVENLEGGPKSRLQVEAALVDGKGKERARRKVYAGNAPTDEELLKATREEIEHRLASPLGDRMANLDVPRGRSVPFAVVFAGMAPGEYTSRVKALNLE